MQDVSFACVNNLAEIRAVTPKLCFLLKRPVSGWNAEVWANVIYPVYYEVRLDVVADLSAACRAEILTSEAADASFMHEIWRRVAEKLGLDYRRGNV